MPVVVAEEPMAALAEVAAVPIAFEVTRVLDVVERDGGLGGLALAERPIGAPYVKDYDAIPGQGPASWAARFDLSRWGLLAAYVDGARVGGAVIAFDTPGVQMLDERRARLDTVHQPVGELRLPKRDCRAHERGQGGGVVGVGADVRDLRELVEERARLLWLSSGEQQSRGGRECQREHLRLPALTGPRG